MAVDGSLAGIRNHFLRGSPPATEHRERCNGTSGTLVGVKEGEGLSAGEVDSQSNGSRTVGS